MKITRIEQQKKQNDRYNLYLDNQFWLGVDENVLVTFAIYKGQDLSEDQQNVIKEYEEKIKYYNRAIDYLGRAMKTRQEVKNYLYRQMKSLESSENYEENIQWILDKLQDQAYLNDLAYAKAFVRTQIQLQGKGPKDIERQLIKKGVDETHIIEALQQYTRADKIDNMQSHIEKYVKSHKNLTRNLLEQKIYQHLQQKGFDSEAISLVKVEDYLCRDEDHEEGLLNKDMDKAYTNYARKYQGYQLKQRIIQAGLRKGHTYDAIQSWLEEEKERFID